MPHDSWSHYSKRAASIEEENAPQKSVSNGTDTSQAADKDPELECRQQLSVSVEDHVEEAERRSLKRPMMMRSWMRQVQH